MAGGSSSIAGFREVTIPKIVNTGQVCDVVKYYKPVGSAGELTVENDPVCVYVHNNDMDDAYLRLSAEISAKLFKAVERGYSLAERSFDPMEMEFCPKAPVRFFYKMLANKSEIEHLDKYCGRDDDPAAQTYDPVEEENARIRRAATERCLDDYSISDCVDVAASSGPRI